MPQHQLTLITIGSLDNGKIVAAVDHELRQIVRDIVDRPGDRAKRKVQLVIEAVPILDRESGALDTIGLRFRISSATPVRQSVEYPMLPTNSGRLLFQEHSPTNPRQTELPYEQRQTKPAAAGADMQATDPRDPIPTDKEAECDASTGEVIEDSDGN
jgi:hypothetical protein